jgi:hypothetical protein
MSALPQAIAPKPHTNLLNAYIQIANKMGFQQQKNFIFLHSVFSIGIRMRNSSKFLPQPLQRVAKNICKKKPGMKIVRAR